MTVKEAFKFYMESMRVALGNFPQGLSTVVERDERSFNMKPESKELLTRGEALKARLVATLALELQKALTTPEEEYTKENEKYKDPREWVPF